MQSFLKLLGATQESIEVEAINDHGKYIDCLKFVLFDRDWGKAHEILRDKMSKK